MKVYFDNRGGAHSYTTIFCDDKKYGNVLLDKDTINSVDIPNGVQVLRISAVTDTYKGLERELIKDIDLCFEKEKIEYVGFMSDEWQYPYDAVLLLNGCNEDIFIYQFTFPQKELDGALGYRARNFADGRQIETKYIKRLEDFGVRGYKILEFIFYSIWCVLGIKFFPNAIESLKMAGSHLEGKGALTVLFMCVLGVFLFICFVYGFISGNGYLQESKLKSEYYLDSDGNWSSSEK